MNEPENMPREKGSLPDGAVEQPDGSYVLPDETVEVTEETEEQKAQRAKLLETAKEQTDSDEHDHDSVPSEQAEMIVPREQGTYVADTNAGEDS